MAVLAGRGREDRVQGEELGEELAEGGIEVGHARSVAGAGASGARRRRYHRAMPAQTWVEPVVLEGTRVRMEPLSMAHFDDLAAVAFDAADLAAGRSWGRRTRPGLRRWMETALANAEAGTERPFATIDLASGRAVGSSRYMSIVPEHKRLEIGWTWLATSAQRTGINREAKLLQLTHAFETLGANRVEFKTHVRNERSRTAIAGIGATFEGVFREPLDHARRLDPRLRLLQRHRARMARR